MSGKRWSVAEQKTLINLWQDFSPRRIKESLPGRKWDAICKKARAMGLSKRYQGYISIEAAARMSGFDPTVIHKALQDNELVAYKLGVGKKLRRKMLDPDDVRDFIECKTSPYMENSDSAGARHGMHRTGLVRILSRFGYKPKTRGEYDSRKVDEILALYWSTLSPCAASYWRRKGRNVASVATKKAHPTKDIALLAGSIVSQALSQMEPGNEHSLSCSDSESTIGQAA